MRGLIARARSLIRGLRSSDSLEREMNDEMQLHIELHTERLMKERGLDRETAERTAKMDFGGIDNYKEAGRDVRGLNRISGLSLDIKLGMRMLWKYPGLTIAGTLTIAVAVALAASWFQFMTDTVRPKLGLAESDRIVRLQNMDVTTGSSESHALGEFVTWKSQLTTVTDLTAAFIGTFNLSTDNRAATVSGAQMSAAGFKLTRVPPIAGRVITEADEAVSAPPVAVITYQLWQRLFDGKRDAIGSTIRVNGVLTTVIGVMPKTFGYPVNQSVWLPLKTTGVVSTGRPTGPSIFITGRLMPGRSVKQARAELDVIAARTTASQPASNHKYHPIVGKFASSGSMVMATTLANVPFILFLFIVCANVGTLVYARTATRESEIAVRSVLGASRKRIVMQLFFEALVLTMTGSALGLISAAIVQPRAMALFWEVQESTPPFWFASKLDTATVVYTFVLAVLAALVIGGMPALKATGKNLRDRIAQPGSGGAGMRFGKVSTMVVTIQVALCVAFLPIAIGIARQAFTQEGGDATKFPADQFITARIVIPSQKTALNATSNDLRDRLRNRIAAERGVTAVGFADVMPGINHGEVEINVDGDTTPRDEIRVLRTDAEFMKAVGTRIIAGRPFTSADANGAGNIVIVDSAYAADSLHSPNPVGMRVKFHARNSGKVSPWDEVVGVAAGITPAVGPGTAVSMFAPLTNEDSTLQLYVHTTGSAPQLAPRVQQMVAATDPGAMAADAMTLKRAWRPFYRSDTYLALGISLIGAIILAFALIGIYALMSFTVSQRSREIGIRSALGANPRSILISIFSRAIMQIGIGVLTGAALVSMTIAKSPEDLRQVVEISGLMMACGLIGCVLPAMRALRIHPTDALRAQ